LSLVGKKEKSLDQTYTKALKYKEFAQGLDLLEKEKYLEAITYFDKSISIDQTFTKPKRNKGLALHKLERYREAIDCYDSIIDYYKSIKVHDGYYYRTLNSKGLSLAALGMHEEAMKCYREALRGNPTFSYAWKNLGDVLYELREYNIASECYETAIKHGTVSEKATALNSKAWLLVNTTEYYHTAYDIITTSLDLKQNDPNALDTKGYILYNLGKDGKNKDMLDQALNIFEKAEKIAKTEQAKLLPRYHMGMVYLQTDDHRSAKKFFDVALKLNPRFAEAINGKAVAISHSGNNKEEAIELTKKAIEYKPSLSVAHENLSKLTMSVVKKQSFLDFWNASWPRRILAIILGVIGFSIILYPAYYGYQQTQTTTNTTRNAADETTITNTVTTVERKIHESYLIALGVIILIIILPEIKKAKIASFELETSHEPLPAQSTLSIR
jgi:tetratricopeptide (TPR) repeat protein